MSDKTNVRESSLNDGGSNYDNEYVEQLEFASAEMQMCLELMISIVQPDREGLVTEEVALAQSKLALDTYHKVLRDFSND